MRTKSVLFRTWLVCLCWVGGVHLVQGDSDDSADVTDNGSQRRQLSPFEEGLQPFYQMTNVFLGFVQNKDLQQVEPQLYNQLYSELNKCIPSSNNANGQQLQQECTEFTVVSILKDNWLSLVKYGLGYLVCIAIGLLFIIIMPLVGFCFCCCRLCGNCGGKVKPREGRHHKCRQYTCGTLLFIFTTIMMVGMVFAFMTNEHMRIRLSPERDGLVSKTHEWLNSVRVFSKTLVKDINGGLNIEFEKKLDSIIQSINKLPDEAIRTLDTVTNSTAILSTAHILATSITKLKTLLTDINKTRNRLVILSKELSSNLTTVKDNVRGVLAACTVNVCDTLRTDLNSLNVTTDFSQKDKDVTVQIEQLKQVGDLEEMIDARTESYNSIKEEVRTNIQKSIDGLTDTKKDVLQHINKVINDIAKEITNMTAHINYIDEILAEDVQPQLKQYGEYYWYAGIGLSCVFLLIVICFYLGLMFGVCGEPSYEDANACNKGVGANLLLGGVGFCFLFCWFLMLVCLLLFIPGALTQGEVCRHLSSNISASPYISIIDEATYPLIKNLNLTNNVSKILSQCHDNQGIYAALGLQNRFKLDMLNIDEYGIKDKTELLNGIDIQFKNVDVIDADSRSQLVALKNSLLDEINFDGFFKELAKVAISENLAKFIVKMENSRGNVPAAKYTEFDKQLVELKTIKTSGIVNLETEMGNLNKSLAELQRLIEGQKGSNVKLSDQIGQLIASLDEAQIKLERGDGLTEIKDLFTKTANDNYIEIQDFIEGTKKTIMYDVGKCRRLYGIGSGLINVVCVDFLYPFNGFWFSFGWCLAFFIPCIITAVHLAGSYRKSEEFDPIDTKSFDDPNFDAYSGGMFPGDNIPLEDYDHRKNRTGAAGRGHPNTAYERDAHPRGHAQPPAAMPYRDNYSRDNYARNGGPPAYPAREHQGGNGGRGNGGNGGATPPNPPHYYNNRPGPY